MTIIAGSLKNLFLHSTSSMLYQRNHNMFLIETERLKLRELNINDTGSLYDILSDPQTMNYYPSPYKYHEVETLLKNFIKSYEKNGFGLWVVILKDEDKFIGECGISLQNIDGVIVPEIGYHINKKYWQNGYATEAAKVSLASGFEQLNFQEIFIHTYVKNIPSRRIAEKLKMDEKKEYDKYIENHRFFMRHIVYSMNIEKFNKLKQ